MVRDRLMRVADWKADPSLVQSLEWQREAFDYYRLIGQVRYLTTVKANTLAQCRFRLGWRNDDGEIVRTQDPRALRVWNSLKPPKGGFRALVREYARLRDIAGEAFLVGTPTSRNADQMEARGDAPGLVWEFLSRQEIRGDRPMQSKLYRDPTGVLSLDTRPIDPRALIARWHFADPEFSSLPDSPLRSAIPDMAEYVALRDVISGSIKSRMSAGILCIPEGMSFGQWDMSMEEGGEARDDMDPLMADLFDHMATPLASRNSIHAFVPLILMGNAEDLQSVRLIDLAPDNDTAWATPLREEKLRMIAQDLDVPPEVMEGRGDANHWCNDEATELLTPEGWRGIDDIDVGTMLLSLDHETGIAEWMPATDIYRADVTNHPMVRVQAIREQGARVVHDSLTTPDHRWPVLRDGRRIIVQAQDLQRGDEVILAAPVQGLPTTPKYTDAFVQLVAWYSADGTAIGKMPQVRIGKSHRTNPDKVAKLHAIFTELFGAPHEGNIPQQLRGDGVPRWTVTVNEERGMTFFNPNKAAAAALLEAVPQKNKAVPLDFIADLTESQLHLYLDAWCSSDGEQERTATGRGTIGQKDPERLDSIEMAANLLGQGTRRRVRKSGGFKRFDHTFLTIRSVQTAIVDKITVESYTGRIWCPTVGNSTTFARREGFTYYTGNTSLLVDADFAAKHVIPAGEDLAVFFTEDFLVPLLAIYEQMDEEEAERFVVIFDPAPITAKADRGVVALRLYQAGLLSGVATVEANDFTVEEMPDEEETRVRTLLDIIRGAPSLAPFLLPYLPGFEDIDIPVPVEEEPVGVIGAAPAPPTAPGEGDEPTGASGGDPSSGGGMPDIPDGLSAFDLLVARVHTSAEMAAERALERAGSRALNAAKRATVDPAVRDRFVGRAKRDVFTLLSDRDLGALGLSAVGLLDGSFEEFERFVVQAVCSYRGDYREAILDAHDIADRLTRDLTMLLASGGGGRTFGGMVVPEDLVRCALEIHLGAGVR